MLELVALYFLCRNNGRLAMRKGLSPGTWKIYTIVAWILAEITGMAIAMNAFGKENLFMVMLIGLFSAFGGYLLVKYNLEKRPDPYDQDFTVRRDDLRP